MNKLTQCSLIIFPLVACGQLKLTPMGGSTEKGSPAKGTATITQPSAPGSNTELSLSDAQGCQKDDSDKLSVQLVGTASSQQASPMISVSVKGVRSTPADYNCAQATDNVTDSTQATSSAFDGCSVEFAMPSQYDPLKLDVFGMIRTNQKIGAFKYSGTCTVKITKTTPTMSGSFQCSKLPRTIVSNEPQVLVDASSGVDVNGSFDCL